MRKALKEVEGDRIKVFAEVSKFGTKQAFKRPPLDTVCLINLKDESGSEISDHLWLTIGKQIANLHLQTGDLISFNARAKQYTKGYFGRRIDVYVPAQVDYTLSNPTKFKREGKQEKGQD
jgi:hypothetical protein